VNLPCISPVTRRLTACALALLLGFPLVSASADPLAPPEAAADDSLLDGKVWLVHAVMDA
jgi:hypothetical protein